MRDSITLGTIYVINAIIFSMTLILFYTHSEEILCKGAPAL